MPYNKRAQIGATLTWAVASVIILVVLLITIVLANFWSFGNDSKKIVINNPSDLFASKSLTAYLLTKDVSGEAVYRELNNTGDFNELNGNLAKSIFKTLYGGDYPSGVYLGLYNPSALFSLERNSYFGSVPLTSKRGGLTGTVYTKDSTEEFIYLSDNKSIHMLLVR